MSTCPFPQKTGVRVGVAERVLVVEAVLEPELDDVHELVFELVTDGVTVREFEFELEPEFELVFELVLETVHELEFELEGVQVFELEGDDDEAHGKRRTRLLLVSATSR